VNTFGFKTLLISGAFLALQAVSAAPAQAGPSLCNGPANGVVDGDEQCETGACCTAKCELKGEDTVCRAKADPECDVAETCGEQAPAVEAACPADAFEKEGDDCDDGLFCTVDDVCTAGTCGGAPNTCDDENDCSTDTCRENGNRCEHDALENGTACEDGNLCTLGDTCQSGECQEGDKKECADENHCTTDKCDKETGECFFENNEKKCDDGNFCTAQDVCAEGACAGTESTCDDGDPCTIDSCDGEAGECSHSPAADGTGCDDGQFCTITDTCVAGVCTGGTDLVDCNDDNDCTEDSCNEQTDTCFYAKAGNGQACDDGSACTADDTCFNGQCQGGEETECADDNACTDDSCDAATGECVFAPNVAPCDDANFCTTGDVCAAGVCTGGPGNGCDDGNGCTVDQCDEETDSCSYENEADGLVCDDGLFCTLGDVCTAGACAGPEENLCDDGNVCTKDSCSESMDECRTSPDNNNEPCDDGLFCTENDACRSGECTGDAIDCGDDNICTDDVCNDDIDACENPNNSAPCDDGNFCTSNDTCGGGTCSVFGSTCDDTNVCTTDSCNEDEDECSYVNAEGPCEDGEFCTVGDSCSEGECASGGARDCGDENACTDDSCDEDANECDNAPNDDPCDDGLFCTVSDACSGGECGGAARDCGDDDVCTDDVCDDTADACTNPFNTAPCDDGQFCTAGDACAAGECVSGGPNDCDDAEDCTNDSCDETANECVNEVRTGACDDGQFCTENEVCVDGVCTGSATDCDDDNLCTTDSCDESANACDNADNTLVCDDGNFCTVEDACSAGQCAGAPRDCGDDDVCTDDVCNDVSDACENPDNTAGCDDGLFCTVLESCSNGECGGGLPNPCDDDNVCTDGSCDEEVNSCIQTPNSVVDCDDGDVCTENDVCAAGVCAGTEIPDCTGTTTTVPTTSTTLPCPVCGDYNGDCVLTASDALGVLQTAVGIHQCSLTVCDFNGDGNITAIDALAVLRAAVDLPSNPMCPGEGVTTTTLL
jgi:hypothetical protein